jgi:hypothetical protein
MRYKTNHPKALDMVVISAYQAMVADLSWHWAFGGVQWN